MPDVGSARLLSFRDMQAMRDAEEASQEAREAIRAERAAERAERLARIEDKRQRDGRAANGTRTARTGTKRRGTRAAQVAPAPVNGQRVFAVGSDGACVMLGWRLKDARNNRKWSFREWSTMRPADNVTGTSESESLDAIDPARVASVWETVAERHDPEACVLDVERRRVTEDRAELRAQVRAVRAAMRMARTDEERARLLFLGWTLVDRDEGR